MPSPPRINLPISPRFVGPGKVRRHLKCTPRELDRWSKDGRLPIAGTAGIGIAEGFLTTNVRLWERHVVARIDGRRVALWRAADRHRLHRPLRK